MDKISRALILATEAFAGQVRKGDRKPAVFHSLEVADIAYRLTKDEDITVAAALHDTIEDAGITLEKIQSEFGERVAFLVSTETENKYRKQNPASTWLQRKQESLGILKETSDLGVKALWLSDKLSNMRSFGRLKEDKGENMWEAFNQKDPKLQQSYYLSIAELLKEFEDTREYKEYIALINKVFDGE